jgi:hypothetical protein
MERVVELVMSLIRAAGEMQMPIHVSSATQNVIQKH